MKIAINATDKGHFKLSDLAKEKIAERKGIKSDKLRSYRYENRADPDLIAVVGELGAAASGGKSDIHVIETPDSVEKYVIYEYDGLEIIIEAGHYWDYGNHYEASN